MFDAPGMRQLQILLDASGVFLPSLFSSVLIPTAYEKRRHLIVGLHFAEHHTFVIDPNEMARHGSHNRNRRALRDPHAQTIGQDARNSGATDAWQPAQLIAEGGKIGAPHAGPG